MFKQLLVVAALAVVVSGCALRGEEQPMADDAADLGASHAQHAIDGEQTALSLELDPMPASPIAEPEPAPTCIYALDMSEDHAAYEGFEASVFWDASARGNVNEADALDLARMAWAAVQTWRASTGYDSAVERSVVARLGHVGAIVADQETVQHAWGGKVKVVGFTSESVGRCTGTAQGQMINDRVDIGAEAHMHELMHGFSQALYGDVDGNHERDAVWKDMLPKAKTLYYSLWRDASTRRSHTN
ncbi:MAG TPA: hypothetical protein VLJ42_10415 [Solirubrobacteraceae bacterium]|nr:hypothetical protein [Solirubrobacteraceae bacterium]